MKETASIFIKNLLNELQLAFWTLCGQTILFGVLSFVLGIGLIIWAFRRKWLHRPYTLWSVVAGLNIVYVPLLLGFLGGMLGFTHGVHVTVDRYIDGVSDLAIPYATEYSQQVIALLPELPWSPENDRPLEVSIAEGVAEYFQFNTQTNSYQLILFINGTIIRYVLDTYGIPQGVRNPASLYRLFQTQQVQESMFNGFPIVLHNACYRYFQSKYLLIGGLFLPFLLIPFAEYLLFWLVSNSLARRKQSASAT
jgi:hypothetical protein